MMMLATRSDGGQPRRIQLRRTRGWRKPEGAVVVARPTRWGNPYRIGDLNPYAATDEFPDGAPMTAEEVVALYAMGVAFLPESAFAPLRGRDLACWCPLVDATGRPVPCHADVLLELANRTPHDQEISS